MLTWAADTRSRSWTYVRTCTIYAIAPYHNHSRAQTNEFVFTSVDFYLWAITRYTYLYIHIYRSHDHARPYSNRTLFISTYWNREKNNWTTLRNWQMEISYLRFQPQLCVGSTWDRQWLSFSWYLSLKQITIGEYLGSIIFFLPIAAYNYA